MHARTSKEGREARNINLQLVADTLHQIGKVNIGDTAGLRSASILSQSFHNGALTFND